MAAEWYFKAIILNKKLFFTRFSALQDQTYQKNLFFFTGFPHLPVTKPCKKKHVFLVFLVLEGRKNCKKQVFLVFLIFLDYGRGIFIEN